MKIHLNEIECKICPVIINRLPKNFAVLIYGWTVMDSTGF